MNRMSTFSGLSVLLAKQYRYSMSAHRDKGACIKGINPKSMVTLNMIDVSCCLHYTLLTVHIFPTFDQNMQN